MKLRIIHILYIVCLLPLLCGCDPLSSDRKDLERVLPVQTVGIDSCGDGVTVSLSSEPISEEKDPLVLSASAGSIEFALTCLQDYSPRDELYFAHAQYILLGSSLAVDGIDSLLDWVERSPAMRMDTALFVVKTSAEQAVTGGSENGNDITERMASLEREERSRGADIYTLRNVAVGLSENGFSLCMAVEALTEEGTVLSGNSGGRTIVPAGYAVFRNMHLIGFLNADESLGLRLLQNNGIGAHITVDGSVLEIFSDRTDIEPAKDSNGNITGILIRTEATANLLETDDPAALDREDLNRTFAETLTEYIGDAVSAGILLDCDLASLAESADISWDAVKLLPVTMEINAEVVRGLDRTEEETA